MEPDYTNIIFDPLVTSRLGRTSDGKSAMIFTFTGHGGEEQHIAYTEPAYLQGVSDLKEEGANYLQLAIEQGYEEAAKEFEATAEPSAPDDLSGMDEED